MARSNLVTLRVLPTVVRRESGSARAPVEIYRPFFVAGLITVLTAGCLLGAIALFAISQSGSYTVSAWTPYILAHANSQLFGWVGFFVMGFALQQHPPTVMRSRLFHALAWASLSLMAIGISLRFVAEPLVSQNRDLGVPLGVLACSLQAVAVGTFLFNTAYTRYRSKEAAAWPTLFVFCSLFWLAAVSIAEPFIFLGSHQASQPLSIQFVAEWFPVLREAQFLGFVAMMIFGVSLTKFSSCFGAQTTHKSHGLFGLAWWCAGLGLRMIGWIWAFRHGLEPGSQVMYFAGGTCLAIGAGYVASACGIFSKLEGALRSHKFLRGAYSWLLISGVLMILEPIHLKVTGQPFSHAYTGAIRHAVTVGFISQMIIGISSHVAARMNDIPDAFLPRLWPTFLLLNIGNTLRVVCEIGTDYTPAAFPLMGISGFIELTGLLLWAGGMARILRPRRALVGALRNG